MVPVPRDTTPRLTTSERGRPFAHLGERVSTRLLAGDDTRGPGREAARRSVDRGSGQPTDPERCQGRPASADDASPE